jgi:hypothetical protein
MGSSSTTTLFLDPPRRRSRSLSRGRGGYPPRTMPGCGGGIPFCVNHYSRLVMCFYSKTKNRGRWNIAREAYRCKINEAKGIETKKGDGYAISRWWWRSSHTTIPAWRAYCLECTRCAVAVRAMPSRLFSLPLLPCSLLSPTTLVSSATTSGAGLCQLRYSRSQIIDEMSLS